MSTRSYTALSHSESLHTHAVLRMLSSQMQGKTHQITTPFGVILKASRGRCVAIGEHVLAPGIDDCSPKVAAEVLYIGTRDDRPGTWCLLRYCGQALPSALVDENAVNTMTGHWTSRQERDSSSSGVAVLRGAHMSSTQRTAARLPA